jgi:hypothetical protein
LFPDNKDTRETKVNRTFIFICVFVLFIPILSFSSCGNSEITLKAQVSSPDNRTFYIDNIDTITWYKTEIFINYEEGDLTTGYKYYAGWMPPGWHEVIAGWRFKDSEDDSYLPALEPPVRLMIRAETEDGEIGTYVREW